VVTLRPQQVKACADVDRLYNIGHKNVLCVAPTGVGKTIIKAEYAKRDFNQGLVTLIFAHRDVLLGQISAACCMMGVAHSFIAADKTVGNITNNNREKFGDNFHNPHSNIVVVSVDTFLARLKKGMIPAEFLTRVHRWMIDECHHLTKGSKWGQCVEALPNAIGLGVTATPIRGDRKGLGNDHDGYFHAMSVTTNMLACIKDGVLTPYKIMAPTAINTKGLKKDSNGDYNTNELYIRTKEADITGSAVDMYRKHLNGKPVITFGINIKHCEEIAREFNDNGIPSKVVSSKSLDTERQRAIQDLREGRLLNLVNCDLFGEGFDAPAVMGVIMLRRTESYSLFKQQFGRMLRTSDGKVFGVLLDHVGNTRYFMEKFALSAPHDDPEWTLERTDSRKKKFDEDAPPPPETIKCGNCQLLGVVKPAEFIDDGSHGMVFIDGTCPDCGWHESDTEKESRQRELKIQAGELQELSFDIIETLIEQRNNAMMTVQQFRKSLGHAPFVHAAVNNHANRQHSLSILRHWIQEWCTRHQALTGQTVALVQLDFELTFGINIFKAQTGTASAMTELAARIQHKFNEVK